MRGNNLLIIHGGAPTAVMNASLYGAVTEAKTHREIGRIYGARGGSLAAARGNYIDLGAVEAGRLEALPRSPSSAIGTSRDHLAPEDYRSLAKSLAEHQIGMVCFNGGNGSMDACGKLYAACQELGTEVRVRRSAATYRDCPSTWWWWSPWAAARAGWLRPAPWRKRAAWAGRTSSICQRGLLTRGAF